MPIITIEYPKKRHDQERVVVVYIDGSKVGEIDVGETIEFEVAAAKHTLLLKSKRRGVAPSIDVDMSDNKNKTITVHPSKQLPKIIWRSFFLTAAISLTITLCFKIEQTWYIYIPTFVIMLLVQQYLTSKTEHLKFKIVD